MEPYPLQFEPILKPRVWGGRRLETLGKKLPPHVPIGESWEIADLETDRSVISNGPLAGQTLRDALDAHGREIMGDAKLIPFRGWAGFPVLIKYLDAQENLSIQVHPDAEYAAVNPEAHVKSEAWVVMAAAPGSIIYAGLKSGVTADQFRDHMESGHVLDDVIAHEACAGQCYWLPGGTVHALGAGVMVAEIQTPSDTTFRVYDWGRNEPGRLLHKEEAMACIRFGECPANPVKPCAEVRAGAIVTSELIATDSFDVGRVDAADSAEFSIVTSGVPEIWMVLNGSGKISCAGTESVEIARGATVLIPAAMRTGLAHLVNGTSLLRVRPPSPLKRMIA